jgi:hypothetical protein
MVTAAARWSGGAADVVAPLNEEWSDAKPECQRRIQATCGAAEYQLTGMVIARAFDTLVREFPDARAEIESWSPSQIVDFYLDI